jgi:hypothetical protein
MTKFIVAFRGVKSSKKSVLLDMGALGGLVCRGTALQAGRSLVLFRKVSILIILLAALWPPAVDSASNRSEYQVSPRG